MSGVITLDGPAGVGKTTLARELAGRLDMPYLDTGAMFRFLALRLGMDGMKMSADELREKAAEWEFSLRGRGEATRLLVNGEAVGDDIRSETAGNLASVLGGSPAIREILRLRQQEIGRATPLVAEGRDLGTVVFPDAARKFFLDASLETRAKRRWLQLLEKGSAPTLEEVAEGMRRRDHNDRTRLVAPLKPADDAIIVDTSDLSREQVLDRLLGACRS